jgi:hypothetical protein
MGRRTDVDRDAESRDERKVKVRVGARVEADGTNKQKGKLMV